MCAHAPDQSLPLGDIIGGFMVLGIFPTKFLQYCMIWTILAWLTSCSLPANHPISVITAFDQSESARNDLEYNRALQSVCRIQTDLSQDQDRLLMLVFAEETQVSDVFTINNRLEALQLCRRQADQMAKARVDQSPGTSLDKVTERIELQISRMVQQGNHPKAMAVIVAIQANESADTLQNLSGTAAKLKQLAQKRIAISIIVADPELHRLLDQAVQGSDIAICPASSADDCIEWSYQTARKLSGKFDQEALGR